MSRPTENGYYWWREAPDANGWAMCRVKQSHVYIMGDTQNIGPWDMDKLLESFPECEFSERLRYPRD